MIQSEYFNDGTLVKHWSDLGVMLLQVETGAKYADPVDAVPCRFTYVETNEPVETEGEAGDGEISAEEALSIILGGVA